MEHLSGGSLVPFRLRFVPSPALFVFVLVVHVVDLSLQGLDLVQVLPFWG